LGITTVTCSAADAAGNTASGSFTVSVIDTTPPVLTVPAAITAEATGPSGALVTFSPSATDLVDGSVNVSCLPAPDATFPLGTTTVTCSASDTRGNIASDTFDVTVVDTTAPDIFDTPANMTVEATSPAGAAITYTSPTATDLVDGPVAVDCQPASGSTFGLGTSTVNCSAADSRGNAATTSFSVSVVDTTAPDITVNSAITDGASYYFGSVPAKPTCTAQDLVSGAVACPVSGYDIKVGQHTITFTATDAAGNTATQTIAYTVLSWTTQGFYQPVDMGGVLNTVKSGSTVPLKFEVFAGATELTATSVVTSLTYKAITASSTTVTDEIELLATGGTVLRYDATDGQFIYNWQTPKNSAGKCFRVTVTFQDGSSISADFKLK
jgi:hypothetical protein